MADSADAPNASPGEILRGARELYGWSLEEVAAELNLLPEVVEALEADDYRHTAGWTYAVGYLRNYARLAGVSIEQAIADRQELLPPKEDGPGTMTEGTPNRPQPVPIQYRWVVTAVVLLLVIGGLYAAYLNRASDVERVRVDLAEESRSQAEVEETGAGAVTESEEEAPAQPALAVTLASPEGDDAEKSNVAGSDVTEAVAGGTAAAPAKPQAPEDSLAQMAAQTEAPAAEPKAKPVEPKKQEEKKAEKKGATSTATVKASENKAKEKSTSGSTSSSTAKTKTAKKASTTKSKQKPATQKQTSTTASVGQRSLNPEFSTAISSMGDAQASASTQPLTADSRGITLKVKESTHVVVWDRDNVELFRRYVGAGKVVSLSGKPPFTLLVSYPEGATIVYGGREFRIPVGKSGRNAKVRVGR